MAETPTIAHPAPSVFLAHGTPMLAYGEDRAAEAYRTYFNTLIGPIKPRAIVALSCYTTSDGEEAQVSASPDYLAFHDFRGFPGDLYQLDHRVRGQPRLAAQIVALLSAAQIPASLVQRPLLDHGTWIPLSIVDPDGEIPLVTVSMPLNKDDPEAARRILKLGKSLASLRTEGVLLFASGSVVHNVGEIQWSGKNSPAPEWASGFETWTKNALTRGDVETLVQYLEEGPEVQRAQPAPEHFLPLLFTVGSALSRDSLRWIFEGVEYSSVSMLSFALESNLH